MAWVLPALTAGKTALDLITEYGPTAVEYGKSALGVLGAADKATGGALREGAKELVAGRGLKSAAEAALMTPKERQAAAKLKSAEAAEARRDKKEEAQYAREEARELRREERDEARAARDFLRQKELMAGIRRAEDTLPMFAGGGAYKPRRMGGAKPRREKLISERESAATALSDMARAKKGAKLVEKRLAKEREEAARRPRKGKKAKKGKRKGQEPLFIPAIGALSTPAPAERKKKG